MESKTLVLNEEQIGDLNRVLSYLWEDELRDLYTAGKGSHIFASLERLNRVLVNCNDETAADHAGHRAQYRAFFAEAWEHLL